MVDSVAVLPPGWRAFDSNGHIITDGILAFYDAGTTDPLVVYSDTTLSTSLGATVSCNSAGFPVTSGNVKTLVYTGADPYKIRLTSVIFGGTVFEFDAVRGALDTSSFLTSAAVADINILPVSTNRTVTTSDKGALLNVNCSAGTIVITLDPADQLGDGFLVGIRHDGTANQVRIIADGTDEFAIPGVVTVAFALTGRGQTSWIACDGVGFKVYSEAEGFIGGTTGIIRIADRLSTPPGSPNPGQRYIVTSGPTGAWSTFAEHDIAEANGAGGWFKYTPPSDCGWVAFVQDEDANYSFIGSVWVQSDASTTVAGRVRLATQAEQEAASSVLLAVPPGRQHFHPSAAKAWVRFTTTTSTTIGADYGVSSLNDAGTGHTGVNFDTSFSSAEYCLASLTTFTTGNSLTTVLSAHSNNPPAAGACAVLTIIGNGTLEDKAINGVAFFGDH